MKRTRILEVRGASSLSLADARLVVTAGPDKGRSLRIDKEEVVVGTSQAADLVLTDETVSRNHLSLRAGQEAYLATDLESTNGSHFHGARFTALQLKPGDAVELGTTRLKLELARGRIDIGLSEAESFGALLGRSVAARRLFSMLETVAREDVGVLLLGETGTGKDAIAEAIHGASRRAASPLVVLDCGALSPGLLESELFGHERGAFTGADRQRKGVFQEADGGTLFIDEVGELPRDLQPKLLRVLESREVRPLGSLRTSAVDVRVIAATSRDLRREVNRGRFREDLFYRLNVVSVRVPPLRERREDIPLLAEHFRRQLSGDVEGTLSPTLLSELALHDWPGNVRELRNRVERAVLAEPALADAEDTTKVRPFREAKGRAIADFERQYLTELVAHASGNTSEAARVGQVDRAYLTTLLRKYEIKAGTRKRR
jgi:DNA-binding NtrC family response regulator